MDIKRAFGRGMLRSAAEDLELRPMYDEEALTAMMNNQPFPDYETWKMQKLQQGSFPNANGMMLK